MTDRCIIRTRAIGIIFESVGMTLRQLLADFIIFIDISNKLIIVNIVQVASIHIFFQEKIEEIFIRREELELFQNAYKLIFCDISNLCDIKILELRFKMKSFRSNNIFITLEQFRKCSLFLRREAKYRMTDRLKDCFLYLPYSE